MKIVWANIIKVILIMAALCCVAIITAVFFNLKNAKQKSKEFDQVNCELELIRGHLKAG